MKFRFQIQPDSDVPASTQLLDQLCYAIASGQLPPGYQLPSTRALAMQTGLHRNTVSKVFQQLEDFGFVDAHAGSGVYVRALGRYARPHSDLPPAVAERVQQAIDDLLTLGRPLAEIRELLTAEVDWRLRSSALVFVAAEAHDLGVGALMQQELLQELSLNTQLVPLEHLATSLAGTDGATVITSRYFSEKVRAAVAGTAARIIPLDINPFEKEIEVIRTLPAESCLGVVCMSSGILRIVEVFGYSLRGDSILVLTAQPDDPARLRAVIRSARTIIADRACADQVRQTIDRLRPELIRLPQLLCADSYIHPESLALLRRELNLGPLPAPNT